MTITVFSVGTEVVIHRPEAEFNGKVSAVMITDPTDPDNGVTYLTDLNDGTTRSDPARDVSHVATYGTFATWGIVT